MGPARGRAGSRRPSRSRSTSRQVSRQPIGALRREQAGVRLRPWALDVLSGVDDGQKLRVKGEGDAGLKGGEAEDDETFYTLEMRCEVQGGG